MSDEPEAGETRDLIIRAKWNPCLHGGGWWVAKDADGRDVLLDAALPAQPAQGEAVADVVRGVWGRCEALEDEAYAKLESDGLTDHERGFWSAQKMVAKSIRRSTEMPTPITPDEAEAMVALAGSGMPDEIYAWAYDDWKSAWNVDDEESPPEAVKYVRADAFAALARLRKADRAEIERLRAELQTAIAFGEEQASLNECACGYDKPSDLCMYHKKFVDRAAEARLTALEADRVKVAETALRMAADLPSYDSDGDPAGQFDHHIFVKRNAILAITPAAVLAAVDSACTPT